MIPPETKRKNIKSINELVENFKNYVKMLMQECKFIEVDVYDFLLKAKINNLLNLQTYRYLNFQYPI